MSQFSIEELSHLSPSALTCYDDCPIKFFVQYILRIYGADNIYSFRGNIFHSCMKGYLWQKYKNINIDTDQILFNVWKKYTFRNPTLISQLDYDEMRAMFDVGTRSYICQKNIKEIEKVFHLILSKEGNDSLCLLMDRYKKPCDCRETWNLKGVVDTAVEDKGKILVVDWKTGKQKSVNFLKKGWQYKIYATKIHLSYPKCQDTSMIFAYVSPCDIKEKKMEITSQDIDGFIRDIQHACSKIANDNEFAPKKSYLCNYCGLGMTCDKVSSMIRHKDSLYKIRCFVKGILT